MLDQFPAWGLLPDRQHLSCLRGVFDEGGKTATLGTLSPSFVATRKEPPVVRRPPGRLRGRKGGCESQHRGPRTPGAERGRRGWRRPGSGVGGLGGSSCAVSANAIATGRHRIPGVVLAGAPTSSNPSARRPRALPGGLGARQTQGPSAGRRRRDRQEPSRKYRSPNVGAMPPRPHRAPGSRPEPVRWGEEDGGVRVTPFGVLEGVNGRGGQAEAWRGNSARTRWQLSSRALRWLGLC